MGQNRRNRLSAMNEYCGNEDMLAAYIDRMLPDDQMALYEKHLLECSRCLSDLIQCRAAYEEIILGAAPVFSSEERAGSRGGGKGGAFQGRIRKILPAAIRSPRVFLAAASMIVILSSAVMLLHYRDASLNEARRDVYAGVAARWTGELRLSCKSGAPAQGISRIRGAGRDGGILEDSEKDLRETLDRDPGSIEARRLLGHIFMIRNQPAVARIYYGQILNIDPRDAGALNDLAVARYREGDLDKALGLLDSAVAAGAVIPETYYNLALMLLESGDPVKADVYINKYLSIDRSSIWSQRLRDLAG